MRGTDSDDFGDISYPTLDLTKVATTDFSSLTIQEKHVWITGAIMASRNYQMDLRIERVKKKDLAAEDEGFSYLSKEELMMMGDLDEEEANNLYNEEPYRCLSLGARSTQRKLKKLLNNLKTEVGYNNIFNQSSDDEEEEDDACLQTQFNRSNEGACSEKNSNIKEIKTSVEIVVQNPIKYQMNNPLKKKKLVN